MATATANPPGPKVNRIGLPVLEYRGGKSTLCAGCGHNAISERIIDAMFEMGVRAGAGDEDERHRLLVEEPGLLHEPLAQLQQRARPHALGVDRRAAGQPHHDCCSASPATATRPPSAWASLST